jgi:beta-phosphoglucomutase-like phosphatase (HAD superfamily)
MKAFIFDIDGTLVISTYIDGKLYKEAVRDYFPDIIFRKDWGKYNNVTDEGILYEIFLDN